MFISWKYLLTDVYDITTEISHVIMLQNSVSYYPICKMSVDGLTVFKVGWKLTGFDVHLSMKGSMLIEQNGLHVFRNCTHKHLIWQT